MIKLLEVLKRYIEVISLLNPFSIFSVTSVIGKKFGIFDWKSRVQTQRNKKMLLKILYGILDFRHIVVLMIIKVESMRREIPGVGRLI